jgi:hypothetical protein
MITQHCDPLSHTSGLGGVKVTEEGVFKPDWSSWSLPAFYAVTEYKNLSKAEQQKSDKFYQALAKLTGRPVANLYENRNMALPNVEFVLCVAKALADAGGVSSQDAYALANLAGGAARAKDFLGNYTNKPLSESDYLDPESLKALDSNTILSDALLRLRANNPGAHEYLVKLIGAKAARRAAQVSLNLSQDRQKVINAGAEAVATVAQAGANVAQGAVDTVGAVGTVGKYLPWVLGGVLVVGGYLFYRKNKGLLG